MGTVTRLDTRVIMRDADGVHIYTKDQWMMVARAIKPDLTDVAYDAMWERYRERKARELRELNT